MKTMKLKTVLACALLVASGSALADAFEYTASGPTEAKAKAAAIQQGRQMCQSIGYSSADVEIIYTWNGGGGPWYAAAIATCI